MLGLFLYVLPDSFECTADRALLEMTVRASEGRRGEKSSKGNE